MPPWDTVGPVGSIPRGPLSMLETDEAQEARASPTSTASGSRGTRDRPAPGPKDRAAGKWPCLEDTSFPTVMAETSLAAVAYSGISRRRLRRADGSLVGDLSAHHAEPGTSGATMLAPGPPASAVEESGDRPTVGGGPAAAGGPGDGAAGA